MKRAYLILFSAIFICSFLLLNVNAQNAIEAIEGWEMSGKADSVTLVPDGGEANKKFIYKISSVQNSADTNKNWFESLFENDLLQLNWKGKKKGLQNSVGNVKTYIVEVSDNSSNKVYVAYLAYISDNNNIRFAKMHSSDERYFLTNFKIAATHFVNLAKKDSGGLPDKPINQPQNNQTNTADASFDSSDIHSFIIHLEYEYGLGGAVYPVYNPYILFKDGTIYDQPNSLNLAASRRNEPKKWGVWKTESGLLKITWNAKPAKYKFSEWKKDSYKNVSPAKKGETISGSFKTMSGGGNTALGGDVMIVSSNTITFNDQGQFTLAKVSGGSTSNITSYYKGKDAGTYTLNGYTIELKFNSGKTERKFFYFYPDKRNYFGIGASVYVPKK